MFYSIIGDTCCSSLLGERINPKGTAQLIGDTRCLRFNVLIREDAKGSPFTASPYNTLGTQGFFIDLLNNFGQMNALDAAVPEITCKEGQRIHVRLGDKEFINSVDYFFD